MIDSEEPYPVDIFGSPEVVGRPEVERGMLPSAVFDFAQDTAERIGINLAAIGLPCLVALATAIRDGWHIQPKQQDWSWTERPIFFMGLTGLTGVKKTAAMRAAMSPLYAVERRWREEDSVEWARYEDEQALYSRAMKSTNREVEPPSKPEKPRMRRLVLSDATTEAIAAIAVDNPDGVLMFRDELMAFIGSLDAYTKSGVTKDKAFYLSAYNGDPHSVDRASGKHIFVDPLCVSVLGGIQDEVLVKLAKSLDRDGFLARFIFTTAIECEELDRAPDKAKYAGYAALVEQVATIAPPHHGEPVRLSSGAAIFREDVARIAKALRDLPTTPAGLRDNLAKWNGMFARMCLVFHLSEYAAMKEYPSMEVSKETARRVRDLFIRLLLPEAVRVYSELLVDDTAETNHARWIAGHILSRKWETISRRDIGRAYGALRGKDDAISRAMNILATMSWVEPVKRPDGTVREWTVSPAAHRIYAQRAETERIMRADKQLRITKAAAVIRSMRQQSDKGNQEIR